MGRKIPGRKHHGVRDPDKQRAERFAKIKDKINAPPSHPDAQDIPKSLARLIELKDKVKTGFYNGKQKKAEQKKPEKINRNNNKTSVYKKPYKKNKKAQPIAVEKPAIDFKQYPGETDRAFVQRCNLVCQTVQKEAAFEDKYGVDIKRNPDTGQVESVVKRPKDELQILINKAKKEQRDKKNKKKKKKKDDDTPKLTKSQKWQLKKTEKKNKKLSNKDRDFNDFKDEVKFGEIVHAPPTLVAPRKVEKSLSAPRPGNKSLLLKSMLGAPTGKSDAQLKSLKQKVIDKKGKRKDLPNALRRQLDNQQKEVIEAYKQLKAKKYTS